MNTLDYGAIAIIPGENCHCELSKHANKRVLYSEVTELLKISQSICSCSFRHYEDRRHTVERRTFNAETLTSNPHQRARPYGRRLVDIHNRARDLFSKVRTEETFALLSS